MTSYLRAIFFVGFTLVILSTAGASGQETTTTLSSLVAQEQVLAVTPWSVGNVDLLCIFSQNKSEPKIDDQLPERRMTVYQESGKSLIRLFDAESGDWFFSAFPTREDGRLLVVWGGGSAYHIVVYAYFEGKVREVLHQGSRNLPEILFNAKGREFILLTSPRMEEGTWKNAAGTTTAFEWDGKSYRKMGVFPWSRRFECVLSSKSCRP
jgi:YD repeat-containing protein